LMSHSRTFTMVILLILTLIDRGFVVPVTESVELTLLQLLHAQLVKVEV
jgi:hypothetical protein